MALVMNVASHAEPLSPGFSVQKGRLLDARGNDFVMRGVNVPHAWFADRTMSSLTDVAATGANTVRLVLATGDQWERTPAEELEKLLDRCAELEMIAVVEVHDCTGFGDKPAAVSLDHAVAYWIDMQPVLTGREATVILNIANEPFGNSQPDDAWLEQHTRAIRELRAAGFTHTLMVDAANWGQDWKQVTLRQAPELLAQDPLENLIFSVHMYEVYDSEERVHDYLEAFVDRDLALVVGEFAAEHNPGQDVAEEAILKWSDHFELGYLAWSWSGNGPPLESLDMVENFDPGKLTPWGTTVIEGPLGIRATAQRATVFAKPGSEP